MKKIILGISLFSLAALALIVYSTHVFANDFKFKHGPRNYHNNHVFNPGNELSKSKCTNATGNPIINVTQKVRNDADSGEAGNYWAFDYYTRHIKVWSTGENSYCAIVAYDGDFFAVPGQVGPGNDPVNERIDSPVNGKMSGGYRATFNGTLSGSPAWPTNGSVGTTNYRCNIVADCPGRVDWVGQYFPGYSNFDQPWWGWQYKAGSHGTWINAVDGNSGNIL